MDMEIWCNSLAADVTERGQLCCLATKGDYLGQESVRSQDRKRKGITVGTSGNGHVGACFESGGSMVTHIRQRNSHWMPHARMTLARLAYNLKACPHSLV